MVRPIRVASVAVFVLAVPALAQFPQPQPQPIPRGPIIPASLTPEPQRLNFPPPAAVLQPGLLPQNFLPPQLPARPQVAPPAAIASAPAQGPTEWNPADPRDDIKLPQKEKAVRFDGSAVTTRKFQDGWQVWSGGVLLRDFGRGQADAEEAVRIIRELRTTEWVGIGAGKPVVEYGLTNGKPHLPTFAPKQTTLIDLATVRVDNIRGVWCLRDDATILVNFGRDKDDAEQAAAVIRKYGFNRLGVIGNPAQMQVLFAQPGVTPVGKGAVGLPGAPAGISQLARVAQEQNLTRTGIEVPGSGFVGERLVLDMKKVEVRKEKGEYVLAHGSDVIARFGMSEWSARDGLRVMQDMRVTEFCRFNADVTFFLVNGQPPTRPPFSVQGTRFDAERLSVKPATAGAIGVYDANGRQLYSVATKAEAEALVNLLKHYKFDQQCQMGLSGRNGLKFLAKVGK